MKKQKTQENSRIENYIVVKPNQSSSIKNYISQTQFRKAMRHYLEHMDNNDFSMTEEFTKIVLQSFNDYVEDVIKILEEMTKWGMNGTGEKKPKTLYATTIKQSIEHLDALRNCVYE